MLRSPLLHFLIAGALLFALQSAWSRVPETPVVEVRQSDVDEQLELFRLQLGRPPTPEEARAVARQVEDEAIWLAQAFDLGLHEIDTVVRQRLVLNMQFLETGPGSADAADRPDAPSSEDPLAREQRLFERALELGMERSDTVVRRRLVDRVQAIVRAAVRARPIDEATLRGHFEATAEQWREPEMLDLTHVYLSRDARGDATQGDAERLLTRLVREAIAPEAATALGDPFLAGHRLRGATPARLVARLGPDFAAGVQGGALARWIGPVDSAFGSHLVWIHERVPSRIPELEEVRTRVVEDWIELESRKALREQVEARRKQIEVRVVDDEPADLAG
ncbi:MAG: peptidyl-prolyl cis-trans isomerase [Spirochaetaceae bacterium]|nr:peptidyl-prolyl cis-trans isomerase [Myxococcales bacterium]MCB9723008.1 peptidyl-prolyl cis-trans isomerase [Spirochaetaceae bacterium]